MPAKNGAVPAETAPSDEALAPQSEEAQERAAEDEGAPVPDLGAAFGPLMEMASDPNMVANMQWQDKKMKAFHNVVTPRWDWMLRVLVAHVRAQSVALKLTVQEPPPPTSAMGTGGKA